MHGAGNCAQKSYVFDTSLLHSFQLVTLSVQLVLGSSQYRCAACDLLPSIRQEMLPPCSEQARLLAAWTRNADKLSRTARTLSSGLSIGAYKKCVKECHGMVEACKRSADEFHLHVEEHGC